MTKIGNLERLYYANKGENFMFDACMRSVLWCLGEPHEYDFTFVSALSGDMFTQTYSPTAPDGTCSYSLTERFFTPDIASHIFEMCGYSSTYMSPEKISEDPGKATEAIIASVNRGVPVVTWGIGNVPVVGHISEVIPEFSLIGGYDDEDILYVNVYREDAVCDELGYATVRNGLGKSRGIFIANGKTSTPSVPDTYRNAVLSLPKWLNKEVMNGYYFGIEAFSEWEKALLNDELYKDMTPENYSSTLWKYHCGALLIVCSYGANAASFVAKAVELNPGFEVGGKIVPIFGRIMELGRDLHFQIQGDFEPPYEKFSDPGFRRLLANQIRKIRGCYEEILRLL